MIKTVQTLLCIILLFALPVFAQEETKADTPDPDINQEDRNVDEEEDVKKISRAIGNILLVHVSDELDYLSESKLLLDNDLFSVKFRGGGVNQPIFSAEPKSFESIIPVFNIHLTLPDPYVGNPAYEVTGVIRNSLNQDRITGKYYWEW